MDSDATPTVAGIGEFELIRRIRLRLSAGPDVLLGPGDDAAVIDSPDGRVLAATDVLVEGVHFRSEWTSPYLIGRRVAAQNLADVVAMGGYAQGLLVGLALPGDMSVDDVLALADGLTAECAEAGAVVAGGDVVAANVLTVSAAALGSTRGGPTVRRDGARPGDRVAVTGQLGWSAAGLAVLRSGLEPGLGAHAGGPAARSAVLAYRCPTPPYAAGPEAAAAGATALVDVSDGLLADLGHIAEASGVWIDLRTDRFDIPNGLRSVANAVGADPWRLVLTGGEDHALAGVFPSDARVPDGWNIVGAVGEHRRSDTQEGAERAMVTVDGRAFADNGGHAHF